MPKISIDLFEDTTFQLVEKSPLDVVLEALSEPFIAAIVLLFGVGAPLIGYALWRLGEQ